MTRALSAVLLVAATASTASAGGYLGLGIGTAPALSSEDAPDVAASSRSVRGLGGMRFGRWSIEGALHGYDAQAYRGYQLSAAGKFSLPLGDRFEAFGRLGLGKTWLDAGNNIYDVSGMGYLIGAGFEYRIDLGVAAGSIFVDYQFNKASLEGDRNRFDMSSRMWTLGVTVGI